jgi:ADP-heptose:LPS heptosyltransferase
MNHLFTAIAIGSLVVTTPVVSALAQAQPAALTQLFPALVGVKLLPAQQEQLKQISQQTIPKIERLLTPKQAQQFDTALAAGKSVRTALLALDLSGSQKFKLARELQSVRSKLTPMLTSEQQQQVAQHAHTLPQHP